MRMPLMPRAAATRPRCRRFGAALLVLLLLPGAAARIANAEEPDPFSVTVPVDATAESAGKAREAARIAGQRRAFAALAERLAGGSAAAGKLAKLDDKTIGGLVASFEVANERMSAVHYLADYTYHFRPAEVRRVLGRAGVALSETPGKPVVVLPVYRAGGEARLWDDPNPWRQAWAEEPPAAGAAHILVPLGDAGDVAAVDAEQAGSGNADALNAMARRNEGDDTVVALAELRGTAGKPSGVEVTARRYRAGKLVDTHVEPLAANAGESEAALLKRAAKVTMAGLAGGWKKQPVPGYDQQGSLTAVLPISGLDDWLRARDRLAAVPAIRKVSLVALSLQEATIEIGYVGSVDQLKASLAQISLDLVRGEPLWRLAHTGSDGTR